MSIRSIKKSPYLEEWIYRDVKPEESGIHPFQCFGKNRSKSTEKAERDRRPIGNW